MSLIELRHARPEDLSLLADYIVRMNAQPASQSLYCAESHAGGVRAALRSAENFPDGWERSFILARTDDEIVAALGCQYDPARVLGWLWGPWIAQSHQPWNVLALPMLDRLLESLPASVHRLEVFLNAENRGGLRFLQSQGFRAGPLTHIYILPRANWPAPAELTADCLALRPAHEVAFSRLHADTFPVGASTPADELLAGRDEEHVIFTASDGLRLLGYVCVSVNHAPREGFIDYLAVRPTARGRGIGARLLQSALRWAFEDRRLPQAALCVSEWRGGARRLYENVGFHLSASGIGARRQLKS